MAADQTTLLGNATIAEEPDEEEAAVEDNLGDYDTKWDDEARTSPGAEALCSMDNGVKHVEVIVPASVQEMFQLSTRKQLVVLMVGICGAAFRGIAVPIANIFLIALANEMIFIEDYTEPEETMVKRMWPHIVRLLTLCACWGLAGGLQSFCFQRYRAAHTARVRSEYFAALLCRDMEWYDINPVAIGALPNQLASDVELIEEAFGERVGAMIVACSGVAASYITGFLMGWQITLLLMGVMPGMACGQIGLSRLVGDTQAGTQQHYASAAAIVDETFYAMRTVIALGHEHRAIEAFEQAMDRVKRLGIRRAVLKGVTIGFSWALLISTYGVCFYYGMLLIYHRRRNHLTDDVFTGADILSAFLCVFAGSSMVGSIDPGLQALQKGRRAMARFLSVRDNETVIQRGYNRLDERKVCKEIRSISMEDVSFSYPSRPHIEVLGGISLIIQRGQKVAFVGESGCGKSTLISLIERFYDCTKGVIKVNGEDLQDYATSTVRAHMGYVGQEPVLFDGTLRENVKMGNPEASEEDFEQALEQAECWFVKTLPGRVECAVGASGSQLSGGQKQRIAIARALIRNPSLLLLDEATSALDNKSEKLIQGTLDQYAHRKGVDLTMVSIAHRLNTIRASDCIYFIRKGMVLERGTHKQLMARQGAYFELAESQVSSLDFEDIETEFADEDDEDGSENDDKEESPNADAFLKIGPNRLSAIIAKEVVRASRLSSSMKMKWIHGTSYAKDIDESIQNGTQTQTSLKSWDSIPKSDSELLKPKQHRVLARLLSYCRQERWLFIPISLFALLSGGVHPMTGVLVIQSLVAFYDPNVERMRMVISIICIIYAVASVLVIVANIITCGLSGIIAESAIKRLRVAMLRTIMRMEMGFHDNPMHSAGMLANHLQILPHRMSSLTDQLGSNFGTGGALVVGLAWAFFSCWQVTFAVLLTVPLVIGAAFIGVVIMFGASREEALRLRGAMQLINDCILNPRTVQSLNMEELSIRIFNSRMKDRSNLMTLATKILAAFIQGFAFCLIPVLITFCTLLTAALIRGGYATFLGANSSMMAVLYGAGGAGAITAHLGDTTKAKEAAIEVFNLLDRPSLIDGLEPTGDMPPQSFEPGFMEFRDICFSYPFRPQVPVLRSMKFQIRAGQSVGLVGPSGGGKSTVLAMIQRFYDPNEGTLHVGQEGLDLRDVNIRWWRQQIGFVGQEPILFNCSVLQNIKYGIPEGKELSMEQLKVYRDMACLQFLFDQSGQGWDTEVGVKGSRLSGGQKQRVAICRALVREPRILMLDEATSSLDSRSEQIVQKALEAARSGRTSFSIAHRLSTVENCDLILVLAEGRVYEQGNDAELMMTEGLYAKLQEAQGKRTFAAC